mgnify:CR=1 FL=1
MTMLDKMRKHKGWLKWSLGLVVLAFIVLYIPAMDQGSTAGPNEIVAEIQTYEVTAQQFQQRYQMQILAMQNTYGDTMNEQLLRQLGIDQQILRQMIDERAALIEAESQGIEVSDEEIAAQIFAIPAFQENGQFVGEQRYEQVLRAQRPPLTKTQFEQGVRETLMAQKLQRTVTDWMSITDQEVEQTYRHRNEKVNLQVVTFAASRFRDTVTVTDGDITSHYQTNKEDFRIGERRKIKFLLLDAEKIRTDTTVPVTDVQQFYSDNIQQYTTEEQIRASHILLSTEGEEIETVRSQAEEIIARANSGQDFSDLARTYSEDGGTKDQGGDLNFFGRGRMVPEFENVAFSMEPGTISDPVVTPYGIHIIKLTEKTPGTSRPLDEVRDEIVPQLKLQLSQQEIARQTILLSEQINEPTDLDKVAKEFGLTVVESGLFTLNEPIPGLGLAPQVAQGVFQLVDGEVSSNLDSPRGPVFATIIGIEEPYIPTLEDAQDRVREALVEDHSMEMSLKRAASISGKLRTARNFSVAAQTLGEESTETGLIARDANIPSIGVNPEVEKIAFELPVNSTSDPIRTDTGTVIIHIADREEVTEDNFLTARNTFREELLNEQRNTFFSAYMGKAKENMTIRVHSDVLQRIVQ